MQAAGQVHRRKVSSWHSAWKVHILLLMVVILDTSKGIKHLIQTRKEAGKFLGVTQNTLRKWLAHPFFLHETYILISVRNKDRPPEAV